MSKARPWDGKWIRGTQLTSHTGQSLTFLARRLDDSADSWPYVMKVLKRNDDPNRRRRMAVEFTILKSCQHLGIVRALDSNAEADSDRELYTVVEFIPGYTLEASIAHTELSLDKAVVLSKALLAAVGHYTNVRSGCLHRDIKPDNIILRDSEPAKPVLIDFGLGYDPELDTNLKTTSGERLGNGFIGMPEFQPGNAGLRSVVSDVTQCAGILFYAITAKSPGMLRDEAEKKPHQRLANEDALRRATGDRYERVISLFDKAFNWSPERRYVSVAALDNALDALLISQPARMSLNERVTSLVTTIAATPQLEEHRRATQAITHLQHVVQKVCGAVHSDRSLNAHIRLAGIHGFGDDATIPRARKTIKLGRTDSNLMYALDFEAAREESQLSLVARFRLIGERFNAFGGTPAVEKLILEQKETVSLYSTDYQRVIGEFVEDRVGAALEWLLQQPVTNS